MKKPIIWCLIMLTAFWLNSIVLWASCTDLYWSNSTDWWEDECICKAWYMRNKSKTKCVEETRELWNYRCAYDYGDYAISEEDDYNNCVCKDWYEFNSQNTKCIKIIKNNNTKDEELKEAIEWMYENWLTIFNSPDTFMSNDNLTREQASKFFAQFASKVLNKDFTENVDLSIFSDIGNADSSLTYYIIQSNYMWLFQGSNWKFMPFNKLTQAQAIAVAIRMIDWYLDETSWKRYENYYNNANNYWLLKRWKFDLTTLDKTNITRWDMALILYNLYKYIENEDVYDVIEYNDNIINASSACVNAFEHISEIEENWTSKQLKTSIDNAISECKDSLKELSEIWAWNNDDSFQKATMNLIANGILFLNKAKEILPYQDLTSITPNQKEKLNKMIDELETLENKIVESSDELTKVQQAFAKKFRYELD